MNMTKAEKIENWGLGPWLEEPDHVEWRHNGVPCIAHRQPRSGHWCGYVGVEPGHPWHSAAPQISGDDDEYQWGTPAEREARVHGGITYGAPCNEAIGICHVAQPGEPDDVFWLGFDCAHWGDYQPNSFYFAKKYGNELWRQSDREVYRDLAYVKRETNQLADQAIARRSGPLSEAP